MMGAGCWLNESVFLSLAFLMCICAYFFLFLFLLFRLISKCSVCCLLMVHVMNVKSKTKTIYELRLVAKISSVEQTLKSCIMHHASSNDTSITFMFSFPICFFFSIFSSCWLAICISRQENQLNALYLNQKRTESLMASDIRFTSSILTIQLFVGLVCVCVLRNGIVKLIVTCKFSNFQKVMQY